LTTKLLLTGHSSVAKQCQTSFCFVLYGFLMVVGVALLWKYMIDASAGKSAIAASCA